MSEEASKNDDGIDFSTVAYLFLLASVFWSYPYGLLFMLPLFIVLEANDMKPGRRLLWAKNQLFDL